MSSEEHYKALFERHLADSQMYQAYLFHSWKTIRSQQKGLNRQARRVTKMRDEIKRLQAELAKWEAAAPGFVVDGMRKTGA